MGRLTSLFFFAGLSIFPLQSCIVLFTLYTWYDRQQTFQWVNDIEYWFNRGRERVMLHVVICTERYMVIDLKTNSLTEKTVRFAWLSRKPINEKMSFTDAIR